MKKNILITSIAFLPNIGGVETHLSDLVEELIRNHWDVTVLTYQPLQTPVRGKWIEKKHNLMIIRLPVIRGWFYKFIDKPALEFLFLAPLHFAVLPLILLIKPNIEVINAQGLVVGFAAAFWSLLWKKRYVIALQNIYQFPNRGYYRMIAKWIINRADKVLVQSVDSANEVYALGIRQSKIVQFTHWENIDVLKPVNKLDAKILLGLKDVFVVSFFGRLVEVKGVNELLRSLRYINPEVVVQIYGEGPLINKLVEYQRRYPNLKYRGIISPDLLPVHYSASDVIIMPSTHEEGFGRVAVGALLCATPVIAARRGALPLIVNDEVGKLIDVSPEQIAKSINYFYTHPNELEKRRKKCRDYAVKKFSPSNSKVIIDVFKS